MGLTWLAANLISLRMDAAPCKNLNELIISSNPGSLAWMDECVYSPSKSDLYLIAVKEWTSHKAGDRSFCKLSDNPNGEDGQHRRFPTGLNCQLHFDVCISCCRCCAVFLFLAFFIEKWKYSCYGYDDDNYTKQWECCIATYNFEER
jgi:hypothetical protein